MGNIGSSGSHGRRRNSSRRSNQPPPSAPQPQPEITANRYVFAAATPYPQYPPQNNPNMPPQSAPPPYYHQYPGYYPPSMQPPPIPLPAPYDHHHMNRHLPTNWVNGRYPYGVAPPPPPPYVEHQKAVTIRNDVNLKKETLRIEADEDGKYVVAFTFDATVSGSITIIFFAKEGEDCSLTPTNDNLFPPVTVQFQQGLAQKFKQPSGTGVDLEAFEEQLSKIEDKDIYHLAIKAEACPEDNHSSTENQSENGSTNSQITQAVLEKDRGEYHVRVLKQILWVNNMRYELQEIYGIGNTVEGEFDGNDPGKECVICLSEPRDTTVLPCRHMCMCSECAKVLRLQTNRCPICRQPVERLLEIKVSSNGTEE